MRVLRTSVAFLLLGVCVPLAAAQPADGGYVRTETAFPTGDRASSPILLERFTPAEVRIGQEFQYEIRLSNQSRGRVDEVTLTERFPAGFNVRSISPQPGHNDAGGATWQIAGLNGGQSLVIKVTGSTNRPEEPTWCATVTFKTTACASTKVVEPKLAIQKVMPPEVMICDEIPIRVTVSNVGTGVARGVVLRDTLPAGLVLPNGHNAFMSNIGDLVAGQARDVTVTAKAQRTGTFTNTASAQETGGPVIEATAATTVRSCNLVVSKQGPALRFVGRPATFDITVQNTGDAPARSVVLTDLIPAGCEIVGADANGQFADARMTWQLGNINPNEARTVHVTVKPTQIGTLTNTATARGICCEASAAATLAVQGIPAILLECVDDPDPIEVGGQTTYDIIVTNQGTATGTNIVVEATIPAEEEYVSAAGPTTGGLESRTLRFAPLATLAPKAKAVYKVVVRGARAGDARFKVTMRSDQTTSIVEETESTHIYE
ncbi:MAG: DUF11 domain-containing protein [Planctomycetes bacterium]|nr:DUF11 domain-containing protein [Planctomycetota bacterium]